MSRNKKQVKTKREKRRIEQRGVTVPHQVPEDKIKVDEYAKFKPTSGMFVPRTSNNQHRNREYSVSSEMSILPTFRRSRTLEGHATYNSTRFLYIMGIDGFAAGQDYFADACLAAIEQGHQVGNMKDKVAAQETAFDNLVQAWMQVLFNLGPMMQIKSLMKNPPESNNSTALGDGDTGNTTVANHEFLTFNSELSELKGKIIPSMALQIWKDYAFVIKVSESYRVHAVDIPEIYVMPFIPYAQSSDLAADIDTIYANQGLSQRHMDKFGVKYERFDPAMLDFRVLSPTDPDSIAFFNHTAIEARGAAGDVTIIPTGNPAAGTHSDRVYRFLDNPNESPINYTLPIFSAAYNNPNNLYGGAFVTFHTSTTQNDAAGVIASEVESSEFLSTTVAAVFHALIQAQAFYDQTATWNLTVTGTTFSADVDLVVNPLTYIYNLKEGKGLTQHVMETALIRYLIQVGMQNP